MQNSALAILILTLLGFIFFLNRLHSIIRNVLNCRLITALNIQNKIADTSWYRFNRSETEAKISHFLACK